MARLPAHPSRRELLSAFPLRAGLAQGADPGLVVPVRQILDAGVNWDAERLRWFRSVLWPEAADDLLKAGIRLQVTVAEGRVERPRFREPVISGLHRAAINFVVTGSIPIQWDDGRGLCGVSTIYRGYHTCMIALSRAHGHQIPFLSVNSCLHELLHVLLLDIFERRPPGPHRELRELRIDALATRLWLFGDGSAIRKPAAGYLARLLAEGTEIGLR